MARRTTGTTGTTGTASANGAARVDKVTVPGAARALAVFEIYAREQRGLTKSELARLLGLPESSTSDLLNTLRDLGYVSRTVTSRQFYPTSRLNELLVEMPGDGLNPFAAEATSLVASETGETAVFARRSGERAEIVASSEGGHRLRYVITAGDTVSLHTTSVGKAVLSGMSPEERATHFEAAGIEALTHKTKRSIAEIEADLAGATERGYFVSEDEGTVGVTSLAVAGRMGELTVGLGIVGPSERFAANRDALVEDLRRVQANIFDR